MKSNIFKLLGLSAVAMLIAFTGFGCGSKNSGGSNTAATIKAASDALAANNPLGAKSKCYNILQSDPNNCSCQWVYALADVQDLAQNQLQVIINNLEIDLIGDNIAGLFTGVSMVLTDIPTRTSVIEANACEFTLPTLPVTVQLDLSSLQSLSSLSSSLSGLLSALPSSVNEQFAFGSQWGPAEAKVLGSTANSLLAVINVISAHSLDTSALISMFTGGGGLPKLNSSDPIGLVRGLASIFTAAPTLLAFNIQGTGPADITSAGNEINAALKEINGLNASLQLDKGNTAKVMSYNDVNGDGVVDGGDTFTVGALYYTNSTWVNIVQALTGAETITIPAMVSKNVMPDMDALLTEFSNNLTNGTPDIVPTDLNNLLGAVGLTAMSFQTNVMSLDPHAFFANPQPLQYFLPTTANGQFQVEAEVTATTTGVPWYYEAGDARHFTDGTSPIAADGISVPVTAENLFTGSLLGMQLTVPAMIPYISFSDPTMDGVLSIDLSQMLEFCEAQGSTEGTLAGSCPANATANFVPADNYRLDKVIAGGIYGLFTDSTTGSPYTTTVGYNPIW